MDYLHTMQQRSKWDRAHPKIKRNDLDILREKLLPPMKSDMARVVQCHPGRDGRVRVVTVTTATSELDHPITQVCRLSVYSDCLNE